MFKRLIKLAQAKTPKVGRRLQKVGVGFAGASVGVEFMKPDIYEFVPEHHRVYIIALQLILGAISAIYLGAGITATTANPDEICKEEND
jgi:hypothetical protein